MRKVIVGLIVAIIIIILLVPYIFGQVLCTTFKKQVLLLNKHPNVFSVSVVKYDNGWFSTNAELLITQPTPPLMLQQYPNLPKKMTYMANLQLHHGPLTFVSSSLSPHAMRWGQGVVTGQVKVVTPLDKAMPQVKGLNQPITVLGAISMTGNVHLMLQTGSYQIFNAKPMPEKLSIGSITFDGFIKSLGRATSMASSTQKTGKSVAVTDAGSVVQQVLSTQLASFKGSFHIKGIDVQGDTSVSIPEVMGHFNYVQHADDYLTGKATMTVPSVVMRDSTQGQLAQINNLKLSTDKELNQSKVKLSQQVTVDSVDLPHGMSIKNIKLNWSLDNANLPGDLIFEQEAPQLDSVPKARQQTVMLKLLDGFLRGSTFTLKTLQADVPQLGNIAINGSVQLPSELPPGSDLFTRNIMALQASHAQFNVSVPAVLLKLLPPMPVMGPGPVLPPGSKPMMKPQVPAPIGLVDLALSRGYIEHKGDSLVSAIEYKNGELFANGKVVDLTPPKVESNKPASSSNQKETPQIMKHIKVTSFKLVPAQPTPVGQVTATGSQPAATLPAANDAMSAVPAQQPVQTQAVQTGTTGSSATIQKPLHESTQVSTISVPNKTYNTTETVQQQTQQMNAALSSNPNLNSSVNTKQTPARED